MTPMRTIDRSVREAEDDGRGRLPIASSLYRERFQIEQQRAGVDGLPVVTAQDVEQQFRARFGFEPIQEKPPRKHAGGKEKRAVVNVNNPAERWPSQLQAAKALGVSMQAVTQSIRKGCRVKGRYLKHAANNESEA